MDRSVGKFAFGFCNPQFSDTSLRVHSAECSSNGPDPEVFPVSSIVLAASSPFFQRLFAGSFREGRKSSSPVDIHLESVSTESFKDLLKFMYSEELPAQVSESLQRTIELMIIADKFEVTDCVSRCMTALDGFRPIDTAEASLLVLSLPASIKRLKPLEDLVDSATAKFMSVGQIALGQGWKECLKHVQPGNQAEEEAKALARSARREFLDLPLGAMESLIEAKQLQPEWEDVVVNAALAWLIHNKKEPGAILECLLSTVVPCLFLEKVSPLMLQELSALLLQSWPEPDNEAGSPKGGQSPEVLEGQPASPVFLDLTSPSGGSTSPAVRDAGQLPGNLPRATTRDGMYRTCPSSPQGSPGSRSRRFERNTEAASGEVLHIERGVEEASSEALGGSRKDDVELEGASEAFGLSDTQREKWEVPAPADTATKLDQPGDKTCAPRKSHTRGETCLHCQDACRKFVEESAEVLGFCRALCAGTKVSTSFIKTASCAFLASAVRISEQHFVVSGALPDMGGMVPWQSREEPRSYTRPGAFPTGWIYCDFPRVLAEKFTSVHTPCRARFDLSLRTFASGRWLKLFGMQRVHNKVLPIMDIYLQREKGMPVQLESIEEVGVGWRFSLQHSECFPAYQEQSESCLRDAGNDPCRMFSLPLDIHSLNRFFPTGVLRIRVDTWAVRESSMG